MNINDILPKELVENMVSFFYLRTNKHISLVNKYGKKMNKDYTYHDLDKLEDTDINTWYIFLTWKYANPEYEYPFDSKLIDEATFKHIKNNVHHPEYWDKNIKNFTRDNELDNMLVDASKMSTLAIHEMCADWCAMSEELGKNTPYDWAKKTINKRWKFTDKQIDEIYKTLDIMWG